MVLVPIARELIKLGVRSTRKYYALEGKAFKKLYRGFPRSTTIGRGVRHGLTAGSITGTFITNNAEDSPGNGIQKPYAKRITSRTPYKTRRRFPVRINTCYPNKRETYSRSRRSSGYSY